MKQRISQFESKWLAGFKSEWLTIHDLRWHTRVSVNPAPASAPTIVLVHGLVVASRYMLPVATRLALDHHVYVPDLPGYGWSDKPRRVLTVGEQADALAAWMEATGLQRAAFLGNSLGCQIIADLAARYPERVSHAIFVGPTVDAHAHTVLRQIARWLRDIPTEPPALGLVQLPDYLVAGPRRIARTFQRMMEDHIEEKLPRIQAPTLIVRGTKDHVVPQDWAEEVSRLLPRGRLAVIPGAAHAINYNAPLELARVTRLFLRGDCAAATQTHK